MEGETGLGSEPQALSLHSKLSCVLSPVPGVIYFHSFEDEISLTSGQELSAHRKDLRGTARLVKSLSCPHYGLSHLRTCLRRKGSIHLRQVTVSLHPEDLTAFFPWK